jgi:hypothetical protein
MADHDGTTANTASPEGSIFPAQLLVLFPEPLIVRSQILNLTKTDVKTNCEFSVGQTINIFFWVGVHLIMNSPPI